MPPKCRLRPGTLSSHRKNAQRDHYYERVECLAARPHSCPNGDAERPTIRASGHLLGTSTFPVHQQHEATPESPSCTLYARATPRRDECAATRSLPSPESSARHMASMRIPRESHSPGPRAHPEHSYPPPARGCAISDLLCTKIPPRTSYGPGHSPGPTDPSTQEDAHRSWREFRKSPVAATPERALGKNCGTGHNVLSLGGPPVVSWHVSISGAR